MDELTLEVLQDYVSIRVAHVESHESFRPTDVSCLRGAYESLLRPFENGTALTKENLAVVVNRELNSTIEEQQAERSQKQLNKETIKLYHLIRCVYNEARAFFDLDRIRDV